MGWEDDPIIKAANQGTAPWETDPIVKPAARIAESPWEDVLAGTQASSGGLLYRGRLPDIVLDPHHAQWYDKALAGVGSIAGDVPAMAVGGAAGSVAGPIGTGAGMMAVPTAIRESLIKGYNSGEISSSADFLTRSRIMIKGLADADVLKATAKAAIVGGATMGIGGLAARAVAPAFSTAARLGGEYGTLSVLPAALDGRLPEREDFANAAITIGGMKAAGLVLKGLTRIYERTGIPPEQVAADAQADPKLKEELKEPELHSAYAELPEVVKPAPEFLSQEFPQTNDAEVAARLAARTSETHRKILSDPELVRSMAKDVGISVEEMRARLTKDLIPARYQPAVDAETVRDALPTPPKIDELVKGFNEPIPDTKTPGHVNYDYVEEPADLAAIMASGSKAFAEQIAEKRNSPKGFDETFAEAKKALSAATGERDIPSGSPSLDAEVMMKYAMLRSAAIDLRTAAKNVIEKGDQATEQDIKQQMAAAAMLKANLANALGKSAEVARALNVHKAMKQVTALASAMQKAKEEFGDDPVRFATMVDNLGDVGRVSRFLTGTEELNTLQKLQAVYRFSLLSGATVFQVKGIGDLSATAERVLRAYLSAGISKIPGFGSGKSSFAEANAMVFAMGQGVRDGLKALVDTWYATNKMRSPDNPMGMRKVFGGEEPGALATAANKVIAFPSRIIASETELFKVLNERMEMARLVSHEAIEKDLQPGTDDYNAAVTDMLQNPTKEMQEKATQAGKEATFTNRLGKLGRLGEQISRTDYGGFILPFWKVPVNLSKWAIQDMPLLSQLTKESQEAWAEGGTARDGVIARQVIGGTVALLAVEGVLKGTITGGSQWMTPQQKQTRIDAKIQDYSFKFPWSDTWHSYNRYQPLGTIAMFAADMSEIYQHANADDKADVAKMTGSVIGHAMISQPYFEGIHQFMEAMTSTQQGARYFDNFIASWVPSFLNQAAATHDPQKRRIDSLMDAVQSRIPIWREQLLPVINPATGEPMEEKRSLTLSQSMTESKDKVLQEAVRLNVGIGKAPKTLSVMKDFGTKEGKVELTPEQQNLFSSTSGQLAHNILSRLVQSDAWERAPDPIKKQIYAKVFAQARKVGAMKALPADKRMILAEDMAEKLRGKLDVSE